MKKPPVINCHAHIFTGDHVPPWLAKTFLPWPLYFLVPVSGVVWLLRWWFRLYDNIRFGIRYKKAERTMYRIRMAMQRMFLLSVLKFVAGLFLFINIIFLCIHIFSLQPGAVTNGFSAFFIAANNWLISLHIIPAGRHYFLLALYMVLFLLFFPAGRNFIIFLLRYIFRFFRFLPGKQSTELIKRYVLLGIFSRYKTQSAIFSKLAAQYPTGTGFVVLPMDMEYMGAGSVPQGHGLLQQMDELVKLKQKKPDVFFPFVFADPRRFKADPQYFKYSLSAAGEIILEDCHCKTWLEENNFSGIKIYPALGYFPFDKELLVLYKYAADRGIPITTHCIRGTIFYRGPKKKEWDEHPVFKQSMGKEQPKNGMGEDTNPGEKPGTEYSPMLLPQISNNDFQVGFTHPLNYLCLLEEKLLRQLVAQSKDDGIKAVFGYTDDATPLARNLSQLKLCFGHFGGDDEWLRFMESDRDVHSSQLQRNPDRGIEFLCSPIGEDRPGKPEVLWKHADWYSIICSLMLQYDHVYADISYILHKPEIVPLLKRTLQHEKLRRRVLFGTDFYVVRNHKSDKDMMAEIAAGLTEAEFDLIARENPQAFLLHSTGK